MIFKPNCSDLSVLIVEVTLPKFASVMFPVGLFMIAVLGKLNDSARNSIERRSPNGNCRNMERSIFQTGELRSTYRPKLPNENAPGAAKAAVLKYFCRVGLSRSGSPIRFGLKYPVFPVFAESPG